MTLTRLLLRSLCYYWRSGMMIVLGIAVATAVMTGSFLVGDAVTGSLRDNALARLGTTHSALVAPVMFRDQLADEIQQQLADRSQHIIPLIISQGAAHPADNDTTAPVIQVYGVEEDFWSCFPHPALPLLEGRQVVVNAALAHDLNVKEGDYLILTLSRGGTTPSQTLFTRRKREETIASLRVRVAAILADHGVGGFTLSSDTAILRNLFISRSWLADYLHEQGKINAMLVAAPGGKEGNPALLTQALSAHTTLDDLGIIVHPARDQQSIVLKSAGLVFSQQQRDAVRRAAETCQATVEESSVFLATTVDVPRTKRQTSYAILAGVASNLDENAIYLSDWSAADLGARVGDRVTLSYLTPSWEGIYRPQQLALTVKEILPTDDPRFNSEIIPDFAGITGASSIEQWNPPFPIDLNKVTPRDDEYWQRYRVKPKLLVNPVVAQRMWQAGDEGKALDWVTAIRLFPAHGTVSPSFTDAVTTSLRHTFPPQSAGMVFRPVRQLALASATGTTDFGQLFLAMSFFIVLSAAGLAAMLMRLMVEQRALSAGVMLACGFSPQTTAGIIALEGMILVCIGVLLGIPGGILYAQGIIKALTTSWLHAVGTTALWLHLTPGALLLGGCCGLLTGAVTMLWSTRRLGWERALPLLAGWQSKPVLLPSRNRWLSLALLICGVMVILLLLLGLWDSAKAPMVFFSVGFLLLLAGVLGGYYLLGLVATKQFTQPKIFLLVLRSAAMNRSRSLLTIGLLAVATFIVVTVAVNARNFSQAEVTQRSSGAGGFSLLATSTLPISYDFGTVMGREQLGFPMETNTMFRDVHVLPLLLSPGEDISCLNIARASTPRLLGISQALIDRGGFSVDTTNQHGNNPWTALNMSLPNGEIPAFGDADTVMWSLHSGLGERYTILGADGHPIKLRFVGLLQSSIFASEILIADPHFRALYPTVTAPRMFLLETPAGATAPVATVLRANLGELGVEVRTTQEVLNRYLSVQNTYLATFFALGGLGLLLGVLGMVIVLLRGAFERRKEFAILQALGFGERFPALLLVIENSALLLAGLSLGAIAALVAVAPHLISAQTPVNWMAVFGLLGLILLTGILACLIAGSTSLRRNVLTGLRGE